MLSTETFSSCIILGFVLRASSHIFVPLIVAQTLYAVVLLPSLTLHSGWTHSTFQLHVEAAHREAAFQIASFSYAPQRATSNLKTTVSCVCVFVVWPHRWRVCCATTMSSIETCLFFPFYSWDFSGQLHSAWNSAHRHSSKVADSKCSALHSKQTDFLSVQPTQLPKVS